VKRHVSCYWMFVLALAAWGGCTHFSAQRANDDQTLLRLLNADGRQLSVSYGPDGTLQVSGYGLRQSDLGVIAGFPVNVIGCEEDEIDDLSPLAGVRLECLTLVRYRSMTRRRQRQPLAGIEVLTNMPLVYEGHRTVAGGEIAAADCRRACRSVLALVRRRDGGPSAAGRSLSTVALLSGFVSTVGQHAAGGHRSSLA
jgi:hypothetical protein